MTPASKPASDGPTATVAEPIPELEQKLAEVPVGPGDRLGRYRVGRLLGQGGASEVFLAYGVKPGTRQRVALKVLRQGFGEGGQRQRFDNECRILASLDHPNIARLHGSHATSAARPYVVMEYVDGERIDAYCDRLRLPIGERLQLLRAVCRAVAAAHRRRVIHLDLKPSNILVTSEGVPKLLDFGIAKLLEPGAEGLMIEPDPSLRRPMTLGYASPEQIAGQPLTTLADVYSLGIVLYKLLAGRLPFPAGWLRSPHERAAFLTARHRPLAPSAAFQRPSEPEQESSVEAAPDAELAAAVARLRSTTPADLRTLLRNQLDTVVLQAIAHRPDARFASMNALAAALQVVDAD